MNDYFSVKIYSHDDEHCERIDFPTDTETVKRTLRCLGAEGDDWHVRFTRASAFNVNNALYSCHDFTEMNYLGALYRELSDFQKVVFMIFAQSDEFKNAPVSTFINIMIAMLDKERFPRFYCGNSITIPPKYRIAA